MNEPHERIAAADASSVPTDGLRPGDPLATTEHEIGSTSTDDTHPSAVESADGLPLVPGYQLLREIARGGMGRVLAAYELALERDVALKVLLPGASSERFVRESKVTARLPHPGIPPVHAIGTMADGSPFLSMKLIVGQTLEDEMKTADRARLLQAFAQVCQAVGFAHSRGVIHRDLKPANVMVGAFGEVQVMDWGLAKDLAGSEVGDEPLATRTQRTSLADIAVDQTTDHVPGESTDDRTHVGTVMGTPAYMAPEQARGEAVDVRSDVFALGGILCTILTGQPPFSGKSSLEVIQRAAAADLTETLLRLDRCEADAELLAMCRHCLSPSPLDRPANGQAVSDAVTVYLNGVQERLQAAQRERAVSVARDLEQRKRRRVQFALAAAVLLAVTLATGGWLWVKTDRDARKSQATRDAIESSSQAALSREQAKSAPATEASALFARAREQAQRASAVVESGLVDEALKAQVLGLLAELDQEERDQRLVDAFAAQSSQTATNAGENRFDMSGSLPKFRQALQAYGLPVGVGDPAAAAMRIRERPPHVQAAVVAALNDWIDMASNPTFKIQEPNLKWLQTVLSAVEPQNEWNRRVQEARAEPNQAKRRAAFERLATTPDVGKLPAASLERLANLLQLDRADAAALKVRRLAQRMYPDDFRANHQLGAAMKSLGPSQQGEVLRYLTAAVALRPDSAGARLNLGQALSARGDAEEGNAHIRKAIELDPKYGNAYNGLGKALAEQGKLDEAIAVYKTAIATDPQDFAPHYNLGNVLKRKGATAEAIASYRQALALNPKFAQAHVNLGLTLADQGQMDEAIASYKDAVKFQPNLLFAHMNLGLALANKGEGAEAVSTLRRAIEIDPKQPMAHGALGQTLMELGRYAEARDALTRAIALLPENHPVRAAASDQLKTCESHLKLQEQPNAKPKAADNREKPNGNKGK